MTMIEVRLDDNVARDGYHVKDRAVRVDIRVVRGTMSCKAWLQINESIRVFLREEVSTPSV